MQLHQITIIANYLQRAHKAFKNIEHKDLIALHEHLEDLQKTLSDINELEEKYSKKPVLMRLPDSVFQMDEVVAMLEKRVSQEVQWQQMRLELFPPVENEL